MDEKTEELRDIFLEVTEADTVTETQEEGRGALASEADVERRLAATVADMRSDLGFETDLGDDALVAVVRGFYVGDDDATIAERLDADTDAVARARLDLHLVGDDDRDPAIDWETLLDRLDDPDHELAGALDTDEAAARWHRRLAETRAERQRVNDRYRVEFESILHDRDIAERMTEAVRQDGLEDATEGMENDLSL